MYDFELNLIKEIQKMLFILFTHTSISTAAIITELQVVGCTIYNIPVPCSNCLITRYLIFLSQDRHLSYEEGIIAVLNETTNNKPLIAFLLLRGIYARNIFLAPEMHSRLTASRTLSS
jgi:hypothetical protein